MERNISEPLNDLNCQFILFNKLYNLLNKKYVLLRHVTNAKNLPILKK